MEDMQREYWNDLAGPKWVASQASLDETLAPYADTLRGSLTGLGPDACIVDVGCGCGATTLMAHRCAPEAQVIGVDVSEPMLELARERADRLRNHGMRFVWADAGSEALPAQSVDRIISRFGVMFFPEPAAAFRNMRRWLKPDGRMVVVVWAPREGNLWMSESMAVLAKHIDLPAPDPDAPGPFALGQASKRAAVFEQAGLRVEEELTLDNPVRVRGSVDEVTEFYAERGPASLALANASAETREAAVAALREFVESVHDGRGVSLPGKALRLTLSVDPNAPDPEPESDSEGPRSAESAEDGREPSAEQSSADAPDAHEAETWTGNQAAAETGGSDADESEGTPRG